MYKIILLLLLLAPINIKANDDFYDLVLGNFGMHSSFIAFDVESNDFDGKVIIENTSFYIYLKNYKNIDRNNYKKFVKQMIINNEKLNLSKVELVKWRFIAIKEIDEVNEYAAKGQEVFINHFFPKGIIVDRASLDVRNAVASKLFEWKVASYIDDESGYLVCDDYQKVK
jgi:hypothetical protein